MTKRQKRSLVRILTAAVLTAVLHWVPAQGILRLVLYLVPYLIVGYDVVWEGITGIGRGQLLDENFLMALATIGAFLLGFLQTGDYLEAVAVMLLYQLGELFQSYAVGKSRKSIAALMDIRPEFARVAQGDDWVQTDPQQVEVGMRIRVDAGERIPLDGVVVSGSSQLDTAALTGESLPRGVGPGDVCCSGCINLSGVLEIETTKVYADSAVARILQMVEEAAANKSRSERFISRFARWYTPLVCLSAVLLAVIPPLWTGDFLQWLYRGLTFLVASCPCALVIGVPLAFFAGIGGAGKGGVLVKGANYLEALAKLETVVLDKTGTLTCGTFGVQKVWSKDGRDVLYYGAMAETYSSHPIGKSLQAACPVKGAEVTEVQQLRGMGIVAIVDGVQVVAGNEKLMQKRNISFTPCEEPGTVVYVALDGSYAGYILLGDQLKPNAAKAMKELKAAGVEQIVMLTGDRREGAQQVADALSLSQYQYGLLPDEKVSALEALKTKKGRTLAFVGDGINDAPVLTRADVGIAMGVMGTDAAIEAADVVLMDDDLQKLAKAVKMAKKCLGIVRQNVVLTVSIKLISLLLVACGLAGMGLAVFADVGVMVLAVLNSTRCLDIHKL